MVHNIWVQIAHIITKTGFYSTIPSDFVLIILTMFYVKRNMGPYKYMITCFAVLGIIFSSVEFIVLPIFHSYNAGFVLFSMSIILDYSKHLTHWLMVTFACFYSSTISLLAVQFLYRYWAIFDQSKLIYFKSWKVTVWVLYVAFFGASWGLGMHYFGAAHKYNIGYVKQEVLNFYEQDLTVLPCFLVVVYGPSNQVRWFNCTYIFIMTAIMASQYSVMIYCGVRMNSEMHQKVTQLSLSLQKLHQQIFRVLVLQVTLPTFFLFAPVVFIIYLPFLDWKVSLPSGIWLSGFTLYPALDAFLVMWIITDYHKAMKSGLTVRRALMMKSYQK